jgi:hypothetical protein
MPITKYLNDIELQERTDCANANSLEVLNILQFWNIAFPWAAADLQTFSFDNDILIKAIDFYGSVRTMNTALIGAIRESRWTLNLGLQPYPAGANYPFWTHSWSFSTEQVQVKKIFGFDSIYGLYLQKNKSVYLSGSSSEVATGWQNADYYLNVYYLNLKT